MEAMRLLYTRALVGALLISMGVACTPDEATPEPAVLTLHIGEHIYLDGDDVELQRLSDRLSASAANQPTYVIYEVAPEAPMAVFNDAMRHLRNAEIAGIRAAQTVGGFQLVVLR